jgi:hypothetical protein
MQPKIFQATSFFVAPFFVFFRSAHVSGGGLPPENAKTERARPPMTKVERTTTVISGVFNWSVPLFYTKMRFRYCHLE